MTAPPLTPEGAAAQAHADRTRVRAALTTASGAVTVAAQALGVAPRTLHRRIASLGLRAWLTETYPRSKRQPCTAPLDIDAIEARAHAHATNLPCVYCLGTGNASDECDAEGGAVDVGGSEDVLTLIAEVRRLRALLAPVQEAARELRDADRLLGGLHHGKIARPDLRRDDLLAAALATIEAKDGAA